MRRKPCCLLACSLLLGSAPLSLARSLASVQAQADKGKGGLKRKGGLRQPLFFPFSPPFTFPALAGRDERGRETPRPSSSHPLHPLFRFVISSVSLHSLTHPPRNPTSAACHNKPGKKRERGSGPLDDASANKPKRRFSHQHHPGGARSVCLQCSPRAASAAL